MSYDDVASAVLPSRRHIRLESRRVREKMALSVWLVQNYAASLWKKKKKIRAEQKKITNRGGERLPLRVEYLGSKRNAQVKRMMLDFGVSTAGHLTRDTRLVHVGSLELTAGNG